RADLYLGTILALVGFNVAGLFEYNWGDIEVQRLALLVMALPFCLEAASGMEGRRALQSAPSPGPSPVRPPRTHPERERGAPSQDEEVSGCLFLRWWRPLPLGAGGWRNARGRIEEGADRGPLRFQDRPLIQLRTQTLRQGSDLLAQQAVVVACDVPNPQRP